MIVQVRRTAGTLLLSIVLGACAGEGDAAPEGSAAPESAAAEGAAAGGDLQAEEQAIRALDQQWVEAIAARDAARIAAFYASDGVLMAPNSPLAEGAEIRRQWEMLLQLPNLSLTFTPTRIRVSPDASTAYDIGTYRLRYSAPHKSIDDEGKYLVVWTRENGEWKMAANMFNSNDPTGG